MQRWNYQNYHYQNIAEYNKQPKFVFIVNFEHISHLFLLFLLLTLNKYMLAGLWYLGYDEDYFITNFQIIWSEPSPSLLPVVQIAV